MAKRSTAHTASAHDSTAPDDSTIPLGEVPEATEVLGAEEKTIGATRNPYQRRSSASGTAQMPHVPDPHSPPTPAQGYPAAPHSAGAYDADPTEHLPYSADPQFSSSPQYAQAPQQYPPNAQYGGPAGYVAYGVPPQAPGATPEGYADTGRPGTRIILQHLFALFVFAVGAVASLYFFVGTYRGQQLDEDALNEYGKQFSGYEGPTLKALDNLPYVVVALAVVGLVLVLIWKHHFVSAVVGVFTAAAATVSTQLLKNTLVKPNYGVQEAVLNSAPSGHTTLAAAAGAAIFLAAPRSLRPAVAVLGSLATCLTGMATMINNWHRPGDVVSAIFVTAFWTVIGLMVLRYFRRSEFRGGKRTIGSVIVLLLTIATLFLGFCSVVLYLIVSVSSLPGGVFVASTSMVLAVGTGCAAALIGLLRPRNRPRPAYTKVWSY